jgi:hypothetical protein
LTSGKDLTIGVNVTEVEADGNVVVQSVGGTVRMKRNGKVISNNGDVVLDGNQGVEVIEGSELKALNGSISTVSTYGQVNVAEMYAGETASAGSNSGNVTIGKVQGKKVVLFSQGADSTVDAQDIDVDEYLVLQGDNVKLDKIDRSRNKGTLNVDASGANGGTMKSKLDIDLEGDVRFTTANVTDAEVHVGGKLGMDKVRVAGKGHF